MKCTMFVVSDVATTSFPLGEIATPSGSTPTGIVIITCRLGEIDDAYRILFFVAHKSKRPSADTATCSGIVNTVDLADAIARRRIKDLDAVAIARANING